MHNPINQSKKLLFSPSKTSYIYLKLPKLAFQMSFVAPAPTQNIYSISGMILTQCARIRVPLVVMKIEKFKDLFRAALDRWWDSHESKNFGGRHTRQPIRLIFSAILPILGKI